MTAEQLGDVIVRANPDGSFVRLKHPARIDLGAENYSQQSFVNGKPATAKALIMLKLL
jgi:multidrug efflux pump